MNETLGEILATIPKPRGEGIWAWLRYYLIKMRSVYRSSYMCAQVGCPETPEIYPWGQPKSPYCSLHSTSEQAKQRKEQFLG